MIITSVLALTFSLPFNAVTLPELKTDQLHLNTIVNAKVNRLIEPKYPMSAARNGKEGWVQLSFVVEPDGTTSNVIVENSSNKDFERSARKAIKKWRYDPAQLDGKAIQQCKNRVQLDFRLANAASGAKKDFIAKFKTTLALIEQEKLTEASQKFAELTERGRWNMYEDAYYWSLASELYRKQADKRQQLKALKRLIHIADKVYDKEKTISIIANGFALASEQKRYGLALNYFEKLNKYAPEHQTTQKLAKYNQQLVDFMAGEQPIFIDANISERHYWTYSLNRNGFSITDVEGKLTNLDVRCENKLSQFLIEEDHTWTIPNSWGACHLVVHGDENTRFSLVEVNSKAKSVQL